MRSLGDYELFTRLGSGTTAEVFLARLRSLEPEPALFAVKTIRPELTRTPSYLSTLARERPGALAFRHPNAARVEAIDGVEGGAVLFAMEPVFGQTFAQVLHLAHLTRTPVPPELWLHVAREVASVLEAAERFGGGERPPMRHGALSPHAILITYEGEVRVLGMATGRSRSLLPVALHTLAYRAPEIFEGATFDGASDLYSLGLTLRDALSGERTYRRRSASEVRAAILESTAAHLTVAGDVAPGVVGLLAEMTSRKRSERPDNFCLVGARLDAALEWDRPARTRALAELMGRWFEEDQRVSRRLVEASLRARAPSTPPTRASSRPGKSSEPPLSLAERRFPSGADLGSSAPGSTPPAREPSAPALQAGAALAPFHPDDGVETASLPGVVVGGDEASEARPRLAPWPARFAERRPLTAEEIRALALDLLHRLSAPPESHEAPTAGHPTSTADAPGDRP